MAPPQEQNIHLQHQHQQMIEPEKVNEIPIQTEIKQVFIPSIHVSQFFFEQNKLRENQKLFVIFKGAFDSIAHHQSR